MRADELGLVLSDARVALDTYLHIAGAPADMAPVLVLVRQLPRP